MFQFMDSVSEGVEFVVREAFFAGVRARRAFDAFFKRPNA